MKMRFIVIGVLLAVVHAGVGAWLGARQAEQAARQRAESLRLTLQGLVDGATPEAAIRRMTEWLAVRIGGRSPADPAVRAALARALAHLPPGAVEIRLLDGEARPLPGQPPLNPAFREAIDRLNMPWLREYGIPVPLRRMARLHERLRQYAVWRTVPRAVPGQIAGIMVLADVRRLSAPWLLHRALHTLRRRGDDVGYIDRARMAVQRLRLTIPPRQLDALLRGYFLHPQTLMRHAGKTLVFMPYREDIMLVGAVRPAPAVVPPGVWAVLLVCCTLAWRVLVGSGGGLTLATFLTAALGVAAGVPLLLTVLFWQVFHETRVQRIVDGLLREQEERLIAVDSAFPRLLRTRRADYVELMRLLEDRIASPAEMLELLALRDLAGRFEAAFFIDSEGRALRDFTNVPCCLRGFHDMAPHERRRTLHAIVRRGFVFAENAVRLAMRLRPDPSLVEEMWACKSSVLTGRKMVEGTAAAGRVFVDRYNQEGGYERPGAPAQPRASNLVVGAAVESQTGNILRWAFSSRGRMINIGSGANVAYLFADIVRWPSGLGEYALILFCDLRRMEEIFLRDFFAQKRPWPADAAYVAESTFNPVVFPESAPARRFDRYRELLVPPRRFISEVGLVDGERKLISAFACRYLGNYILVGVRPWRVVVEREADVWRQMLGLGLIMAMLLLAISRRLYYAVLTPSAALLQGIHAMERKSFDHRISVGTGDEWDEIARLFNRTLEDMEELELARMVQTRLFPEGPVSGSRGTFVGRNVMTDEVGGDYFDAIPLADGSLFFVIGDVQGHGLSAALVVAMAKSAVQVFISRGVHAPAALLKRLNEVVLRHFGRKMSMTFQAGLLRPDGTLLFANAGNPYPFLLLPGQPPQKIEQVGFPLGITHRGRYEELQISTCDGAALVMYTDGILEQRNESDQPFGFGGLEASLVGVPAGGPEVVIDVVNQSLRGFSGTRAWDDDVTVAVVRVHAAREVVAIPPRGA